MMEDQLERLKNNVWIKLPQLNLQELLQIHETLNLGELEETKRSKKSAVYGSISRFFLSDKVEEMGLENAIAMFANAESVLEVLLKQGFKEESTNEASTSGSYGRTSSNEVGDEATYSEEVEVDDRQRESSDMEQRLANLIRLQQRILKEQQSRVEVQRLRDFKINGSVGNTSKDSLSYSSLMFQIKQGKEAGYSIGEVIAAVIKAIKPGTQLREYLECRGEIAEEGFIQVLRTHYGEKESGAVLNEMSSSYQKAGESEVDFCFRLLSMSRRVKTLSLEENNPIDEAMIRRTFLSALATGVRQGAVRLELQNLLRNCKLNDEDLLKEIGQIAAKEREHQAKMGSVSSRSAVVNEIDLLNGKESCSDKVQGKKDDSVIAMLNKLSAQVAELSTLKNEVKSLQDKMARQEGKGETKKFVKCDECQRSGIFCKHCTNCGQLGHKRFQCPSLNN